MPGQLCCLCVSDEGVFLDITPENQPSFDRQFEACFTPKVNKITALSSKICYKCAYELEQCTKFIQKCKKSQDSSKDLKAKRSTPYCCLCFEYIESGHIFDISKDNRNVFSPLQKIRNIFNEDVIKKNDDSKLICLTCRYNLDVLFDLKKVYEGTSNNLKILTNGNIDYSVFPKVHTDVVNRKTTTTIITSADITYCTLVTSDSDNSEDMTRGRKRVKNRNATNSRSNAKPKVRICDECCSVVANGNDMYRFHRTGLTVCKSCWTTMDPSKGKTKRRSRNSSAETKLCAVFLKDVLSKEYKNEKMYKVKTDEDGNKLYVISDDSSQDEDRSQSVSPKEIQIINGSRRGKKRQIDATKSDIEGSISSRIQKLSFSKLRLGKKQRPSKASSDVEHPSTSSLNRRRYTRKAVHSDQSSDSDTSLLILKKVKQVHISELDKSAKRNNSSASDAEDTNKKSRKKLKSILEKVPANVRSEQSDETSSNEGNASLKKRTKNTSATDTNKKEIEKKSRETRSRTRSSSISSKEMTPPAEFKSPKSVTTSEVKTDYTCDKCNKKFDTKLLSVEHKLTHFKQAKLKLKRIVISHDEEKQDIKVDPEENKTNSETKAHSSRTVSTDKHNDDPSEEISINLDDDTDDEDILLSVLKRKTVRKVEKKKRDDSDDNGDDKGDDDVIDIDKSDMVEKETRVEEESTEIQNDETITRDTRQLEDSTVASDEKIESVDQKKKDTKNKDTETPTDEKDTLKDNNAQEDTAAIEQDDLNDLNMEKGEDANVQNAEISVTEKEKAASECNNDKEKRNNDDETDDKETAESSVSVNIKNNKNNTIKNNLDVSKSLNSDVENRCKDQGNKIIEDVEMCHLMNDSREEDAKTLGEEKETITNVNDITETLNNIKDLNEMIAIVDDDKVENTEMRQNGIGEQRAETEAIVDLDKSNSIEDNVKSNLSNCKRLDNVKDGDADGEGVALLIDNNGDIIFEKKKSLEKKEDLGLLGISNSNELIEIDVTNKKCEIQENSKHALPSNSSNTEILSEVFDLASTETQQREDNNSVKNLVNDDDVEMETLENISREIRNSADMPSLDPICVMDIDDDNDMTLT